MRIVLQPHVDFCHDAWHNKFNIIIERTVANGSCYFRNLLFCPTHPFRIICLSETILTRPLMDALHRNGSVRLLLCRNAYLVFRSLSFLSPCFRMTQFAFYYKVVIILEMTVAVCGCGNRFCSQRHRVHGEEKNSSDD